MRKVECTDSGCTISNMKSSVIPMSNGLTKIKKSHRRRRKSGGKVKRVKRVGQKRRTKRTGKKRRRVTKKR
jgi:hypothetical protein